MQDQSSEDAYLPEFEAAIQLAVEDPSSAFALSGLQEQLRRLSNSSDRDTRELTAALHNLLLQINSGIVPVTSKLRPLLADIREYYVANSAASTHEGDVSDLLARVDFEASGGNAEESGAVKFDIPSPIEGFTTEAVRDPSLIRDPIKVPEQTESTEALNEHARIESSFALEQAERFQVALESMRRSISQSDRSGHGLDSNSLGALRTSEQIESIEQELFETSSTLASLATASGQISHQVIHKHLKQQFRGVECAAPGKPFNIHGSLWNELQLLVKEHVFSPLGHVVQKIECHGKKQDLVLSFELTTKEERNSDQDEEFVISEVLDSLREKTASLGGRTRVKQIDTSAMQVSVRVPLGNRVISAVVGSVGSDSYAIPHHSIDAVLPANEKLEISPSTGLTHGEGSYTIEELSRTSLSPQYFVLVRVAGEKSAIPFTSLRTEQKLIVRHTSSIPYSSSGSVLFDGHVCLYPNLSGSKQTTHSNQTIGLEPLVFAIGANEQQLIFVSQLARSCGCTTVAWATTEAAIGSYTEFRPVATVLFPSLSEIESGSWKTHIRQLRENADEGTSAILVANQSRQGPEEPTDTESWESEPNLYVCNNDQSLLDALLEVCRNTPANDSTRDHDKNLNTTDS